MMNYFVEDSHQWNSHNRGRCGICGDPFDAKIRENELPHGKYAKPLKITGKYEEGSEIDVKVELTAAHYGFFEFKICPWATDDKEVTQECLDRHVITIVGSKSDMQCGLIHEGPHTGADADKYRITDYTARTYNIRLRLPKGLACRRCVLQWTYTGGIHWGKCPDGTSRHGCGPQETFRSCADISIYFKGRGK